MRVLIFGDSITQGMWDSKGGWAQRLVDDFFREQMKDLDADVPWIFNLGVSSDTTISLLRRFESESIARRVSDMAFVFAIGTNDAWMYADGSFNMSPTTYAKNLRQIITRAQSYSGRILFVGLPSVDETRTTPVSWIDISYTNQRLALFDQTLRQVCAEQRVAFAPIFEKFKKQQASRNLLLDGLHPNDAGHELIYHNVKLALTGMLGRKKT